MPAPHRPEAEATPRPGFNPDSGGWTTPATIPEGSAMRGDDVHAQTRAGVGGEAIVVVTGQIDPATASSFQRVLDDAARERAQLTVDLTRLGFLDSAGIKVLFYLATRVDLNLIVDPRSVLASTLAVTGLEQVSTIREAGPPEHHRAGS